ncbi:acyl transferase/acyl hydrolase/lysophospholipase [Lipomyces japonicus]|uniref:acyl transferase/acyl hydrolase/lysophospholipase n=1 Tax=Lipomyces japonicus TaxID=56871 RepID=UPI0034CD3901
MHVRRLWKTLIPVTTQTRRRYIILAGAGIATASLTDHAIRNDDNKLTKSLKPDNYDDGHYSNNNNNQKKKINGSDDNKFKQVQDSLNSTWDNMRTHYLQLHTKVQQSLADAAEWDTVISSITNWSSSWPSWVSKLQAIIDIDDPAGLGFEIIRDAHDESVNPELAITTAYVRVGTELPDEETRFRDCRSRFTKAGLARYLNVPESSVDERDVPVIAITGSGGGYRAMIATAGYVLSAEQTGLLDCVTYLAGVSGSCWLLAVYYAMARGSGVADVLEHVKARVGTHIAFLPAVINLFMTAPTDKYLLHGVVEKANRYGHAAIALPDVYGVLLASRLMVPADEVTIDRAGLKISNQRELVDMGAVPMPIYTAVRHEIGLTEAEQRKADEKADGNTDTAAAAGYELAHKRTSWFQWFEFTPYEFGSEEAGAWIPTWSLGRRFQNGKSVDVVPEVDMSLLLGTFGSAFCATLSHYYREIRPLISSSVIVGGDSGRNLLDNMLRENEEDLKQVHPISPSGLPNHVAGLEDLLPASCPASMHTSDQIELMDAGMDNNLAFYPLLRPHRGVDMILAFDCSADVQTVPWLDVTADYVKKKGIRGWPADARWPKEADEPEQDNGDKESERRPAEKAARTLGPVSIWSGTMDDADDNHVVVEPGRISTQQELDARVSSVTAGLTLAYCPLIPNHAAVPGVDPDSSPYMSTWNFIYSPDQVANVVALAQENFAAGQDDIRHVVRLIYERKRRNRLSNEQRDRESWRGKVLHGR